MLDSGSNKFVTDTNVGGKIDKNNGELRLPFFVEKNMEVKKILTEYNHNDGTIDRIKYIVIHYTGATSSAQSNCNYFATGNRGASAHYFVDHNGDIYQSVEDKDIAWHCGAKKYYHPECRNANSIGIEMCCRNNTSDKSASSKGWYFEEATVNAAVELTRELMAKYNIPLENVVRHYDVTHKCCPNPYVLDSSKWDAFKLTLGTSQDGWVKSNDSWKYYKDGNTLTGWQIIEHQKYYFDENGIMQTGWQFIDDGWYYFEESGYSQEGTLWVSDENGCQSRYHNNFV